jgi:hypothetical protein
MTSDFAALTYADYANFDRRWIDRAAPPGCVNWQTAEVNGCHNASTLFERMRVTLPSNGNPTSISLE